MKVNLEGNIMKKKTVQNNGKTTGQSGNPDGKPEERRSRGDSQKGARAIFKALKKESPRVEGS